MTSLVMDLFENELILPFWTVLCGAHSLPGTSVLQPRLMACLESFDCVGNNNVLIVIIGRILF